MIRRRAVVLIALLLALGAVAPSAYAVDLVLAQEVGEDSDGDVSEQEETGGGEETTGTGEDEGSGEEAAETGAGGESEEASAETGPPWTYQMARMTAALVLILALLMGLMYWRLVVQRSRGRA